MEDFMRPYRFLTVLLALVTIVGLPGYGWAQAGAGRRGDAGPTPDETAVHDYVLSMDKVAKYAEAMQCHLGDFHEYSGLRRELTDLEKKNARAEGRGGTPHGESRTERDRRQRRIAELGERFLPQ